MLQSDCVIDIGSGLFGSFNHQNWIQLIQMRVTFDTLAFNIDAEISIAQHSRLYQKFISFFPFLFRLSVGFFFISGHQKMRVRCLTTEINLINSDARTMEMWPFFTHFDTHFALRNGHRIVFTPDSFFSYFKMTNFMWKPEYSTDFHSVSCDRVFRKQDSSNNKQREKNDQEYLNKNKITWSFH